MDIMKLGKRRIASVKIIRQIIGMFKSRKTQINNINKKRKPGKMK